MKRNAFILSFIFTFGGLDSIVFAQLAVPVWTNFFNGSSSAQAVAVDTNGDVFVTGTDFVTLKYSNAGVPLWTNRYNGSEAYAMRLDGSGNVFVTGRSIDSGNYGYLTIAYSGAGVPLWTNRYNEPSYRPSYAAALAVDGSGNVFVTGCSYQGSNAFPDFLTIGYSSTGVPLWTNRYNGSGNTDDEAKAIGLDTNGNVFVTGSSYSGNDFNSADFATIKYSNAGVPFWTNTFNGPGNDADQARAIAIDSNGDVIVTGSSSGTNAPVYETAYATVKYSNAGLPLWTNRYGVPGSHLHVPTSITTDSNGDVFVTGFSYETPYPDYATVGYSGDGAPLWTNRYNGSGGTFGTFDQANAIAVDARGNVLVTGGSSGSTSGNDCLTVAYSNVGLPLWTNRFTGPNNYSVYGKAIASDGRGNVFVAGSSSNDGTNSNFVAIKYSLTVPLGIRVANNQALLTWTNVAFGWTNLGFLLQSAPAATGSFTNIPGVTSPYTNPISGAQQFFRLISN